jgi:hypothetical protein
VLLVEEFALASPLGSKTLVQGQLIGAEQTVNALNLMVVNGSRAGRHFSDTASRSGLIFRLACRNPRGSIQDCMRPLIC